MKLDRKTPPKIKALNSMDFLKVSTQYCSNGVPIHYINHGEQEIVRLQFLFEEAGSYFQELPLIASTVNKVLLEGTAKHSSLEIANYFENRGAFLDMELSADTATLSVYCLTKNLEELLPLIDEMLHSASFPQSELDNYLSIQAQNFAVNNQKVGFIAKNNFLTAILGQESRYSNKLEKKHFNEVKRESILSFYEKQYKNGSFSIYAAGKVDDKMLLSLEKQFGNLKKEQTVQTNLDVNYEGFAYCKDDLRIPKPNALQSAIRIGKPIISKSHPDFPALFFTNAVLGGYFGSRLMGNIREDKGYTYGIGSGLVSYKNAAYFVISTEVGAEVTEATLVEIEKEVNLLQNESLNDSELNLVRNYLSGSILKNFDGAFAAMDRFQSINNLGLGYDYYDNLVEEIKEINAPKVQEMAQKYMNFKDFRKIIAGKV